MRLQLIRLLSGQEFRIAKKLLQNPNVKKLDAKTVESICLTASREFYDNASSGNLHHGDMKLAYDWSVLVQIIL